MRIGENHKSYGLCVAMVCIEGEPYRFFLKDGSVSMIPLDSLTKEKGVEGVDRAE